MARLFQFIVDAVRRPRQELSRRQHQVRYAWDLSAHCWRQLMRHRAEGMAAELTYRTIFALIPVVVLGLVMFRIFGGLDDVQQKVEGQLFSFFGVPEIPDDYAKLDPPEATALQPIAPANDTAGETALVPLNNDVARDATAIRQNDAAATDNKPVPEREPAEVGGDAVAQQQEAKRQARASIRQSLHEAVSAVASIDFASIGFVGLLLFIYAAMALADSVEDLFNRIFDAPAQRPIHIRVAIHWSIITLGSGLLAMSLYLSGQVVDWFGPNDENSNIKYFLSHVLSIAASWVLLFLLYALMPNTHVSVKAAAVGALVGSLLWETAKFGFQIYVFKALPYGAIYGSLGLIPLFLFWIYVTWFIVLFGLILTYTLQTLRGRRLIREEYAESDLLSGDPDWMVPIMTEVAHAFDEGEPVDDQELADRLGLSSRITHEMVSKLVEAKLLRKVSSGAGEEDLLTLARPAEKINLADILALAHQSRPTSNHPAWQALADLKRAERDAANNKTLADL